jgi:hypothetical protein
LIQQGQANLGRIRRQNPQPLPKWLLRDTFIHQAQQLPIERIKDIRKYMTARLRKGTGGDHSGQTGASRQQSEESVKFCLHRTPDAGEQESNQMGEAQITLAREIPALTACDLKKVAAVDVGSELI